MDGNKAWNKFFNWFNFQFTCQYFKEFSCIYLLISSLLTIYEEGLFCKDSHGFPKWQQSHRQNRIDEGHQYTQSWHCDHHLKLLLFFDLRSLLELFLGLFFLEFFMDNSIELFQIFILLQKLVNCGRLDRIQHCLI